MVYIHRGLGNNKQYIVRAIYDWVNSCPNEWILNVLNYICIKLAKQVFFRRKFTEHKTNYLLDRTDRSVSFFYSQILISELCRPTSKLLMNQFLNSSSKHTDKSDWTQNKTNNKKNTPKIPLDLSNLPFRHCIIGYFVHRYQIIYIISMSDKPCTINWVILTRHFMFKILLTKLLFIYLLKNYYMAITWHSKIQKKLKLPEQR